MPDPSSRRILLVDDEPANLRLLEGILKRFGYTELTSLGDSREVERAVKEWAPDLLLLDLHMPFRTGFEIIDDLRAMLGPEVYLPILVLTADVTPEAKQQAFNSGAQDFLTKPFDATEVILRVRNLLETRSLHVKLQDHNELLEVRVQERTAELRETIRKLIESEEKIQASVEETVRRLSWAAEFRDQETALHIERVGRYSALLAEGVGLDSDTVALIRIASPMHDIGKIGIPDEILFKPGKYTEHEFEIMKKHPEFGFKILDGSDAELLQMAATIAWTHHERWDGSGYPRNLSGQEIPVVGRIVALADAFDALSTKRVYKEAFTHDEVIRILVEGRGAHFDPDIVDVMMSDIDRLLEIRSELTD